MPADMFYNFITELFKKALKLAPTLIFIDEINLLTVTLNKDKGASNCAIKSELLNPWGWLRSTQGNIIVVGATYIPWAIDGPFLRRLTRRVYNGPPDVEACCHLLPMTWSNFRHNLTAVQIQELAALPCMRNFSCDDIGVILNKHSQISVDDVTQIRCYKKVRFLFCAIGMKVIGW